MKPLLAFLAFVITCSCLPVSLWAQNEPPPATDIYIMTIGKNQKGKYELGSPEKITSWEGYDNQPYFLPDGTGILYTSIRENSKADIYKFTFQFSQTAQVTHTPLTGEYSPMLMPDKSGISCVRVLEDDSTQLLCKMTKGDEYTPLFPNTNPVGYYCWATNDLVSMFVLGNPKSGKPQTLWLGNVKTGEVRKIGERIGRCMVRMPGKTSNGFYFVQFNEDSTSSDIQFYDVKKNTATKVISTLTDAEDFAVMPDGTFLMGSGSELYKYLPGTDEDWKKIDDFEGTAVEKFYRISVSPLGDKIAVVTYPDERP